MAKAILFDLDNTLVDFMAMKRKSCEAAIDEMISAGLKMKKEDALKILFELYDKYGIEYKQIFQKFLQKIEGKIDYRILSHGIVAYRRIKVSYLYPYPNVIPTLLELKKKHKLAIISDAPRMRAWMRLSAMKIDNFFDVVITSGDVKRKKNSVIPFRAALKQLGIKPEEALMVGDWIERDINTAKSIGIKTCYARYGNEEKRASEADYEIDDIKDLLKLEL